METGSAPASDSDRSRRPTCTTDQDFNNVKTNLPLSSSTDSSEGVKPKVEEDNFPVVVKREPRSRCDSAENSFGENRVDCGNGGKEEDNLKPFFHIKEEKVIVESGDFVTEMKEQNIVSEGHVCKVKDDLKPTLDCKILVAKDELVSLFRDDPFLKQESPESTSLVKTESQFGHFDVELNVENIVKQELSEGADLRVVKEIEGEIEGRVRDVKEICAELMLGEDNDSLSQVGEMQLKISNVRSLSDSTDIGHSSSTSLSIRESLDLDVTMMTKNDGDGTDSNLEDKTETFATKSSKEGVLLLRPCSPVIGHPATYDSSVMGKHGGLLFQRHSGAENEDKLYKFDVCGTGFSEKCKLKLHTRIHIGEKPYKCEVCNARFAWNSSLQYHKRIHTGEKPYKCEVCDARFTLNSSLQMHRRIHTGEKPYKCEVCGAGFARNSNLYMHRRTHTGEKPYKCEICDARFALKPSLQKHRRIHTGEKPYKCEVCDARFAWDSSLQYHKRIHTGEKPYKCEICDARFALNSNLHKHRRTHKGEKPYKCEVCDARFAQMSSVHRHKRMHTEEKQYRCEVCGARFARNFNLERHKIVHTGEKPYKCEVCDARFALNCSLHKHRRIHTEEKPYKCEVCDARFTFSSNLQNHRRIHTGEKPYKCEVCGAGFAWKANLERHERIHTGEKPYKCEVCGAGFARNANLHSHRRIHTGKKNVQM